jgi:fucokinase
MASPAVSLDARRTFAELISSTAAAPWWDAVVLTASSTRQAERYMEEIRRREQQSKIPHALYCAVPDAGGRRIGSGGATLNALRAIAPKFNDRWENARILVIHSGGDSRRLPQYSLSGKLFGALPVRTPWGEVSTVFDEFLTLSCGWAKRLGAGLVVASGDVVLTFDAAHLDWSREGVTGVALRAPVEVGSQHGVYIADPSGRVYTFLQKPSEAETAAAGGLLDGGTVAVDSGLIRFDPALTARLAEIGTRAGEYVPYIDLYRHFTMALTGQWKIAEDEHAIVRELHSVLAGRPFWCSVIDGDFTHVGTTRSFHQLVTEETHFSKLYEARQRLEVATPEGVRSAGVIIDSVLAPGSELGAASIAIECDLQVPLSLGRGAILHGARDLDRAIEIPDGVVVHQVPVAVDDEKRGTVVRVYGVEDDPKSAVWFGRSLQEELERRGINAAEVWGELPEQERILWNAELFPLGAVSDAWRAARWLMGYGGDYSLDEWRLKPRFSLATSAQWADMQRVSEQHLRRMQSGWERTAVALTRSGADIQPLLANAPGVAALAAAGRAIEDEAGRAESAAPALAASQHFRASLFFAKAGLMEQSDRLQSAAFECVQSAVNAGAVDGGHWAAARDWMFDEVMVSAPPRIDLGGGWSDTPPFCLDWGGTVLNIALEIDGECPIRTRIQRIDEPVIRCGVSGTNEAVTYSTSEQILGAAEPGSPFTIPRVALSMAGLIRPGQELRRVLRARGGGIEITSEVKLPMGSGLGTSSILAATMVRALAEMCGVALSDAVLADEVMRLEQRMTTGGGWQDQVGGIYSGAKLVTSGPGLRQRLRVEPVGWSSDRAAEFADRLVLYNTGLQRMAKNLLRQVVGSYLAREVATVQVLHGIKTLAMEMAYAMRDGEWEYLGTLIDRHWELNQILDPHTTNAPINNILARVRPYVYGAKLAGAGGGGYLILLAKDARLAAELRHELGGAEQVAIAQSGIRVTQYPGKHLSH